MIARVTAAICGQDVAWIKSLAEALYVCKVDIADMDYVQRNGRLCSVLMWDEYLVLWSECSIELPTVTDATLDVQSPRYGELAPRRIRDP